MLPQFWHGSLTILPSPLHVWQGCTLTNVPNKLLDCEWISPVPPHVGHVFAPVPGLEPVPLQTEHFLNFFIFMVLLTPVAISSNVSLRFTLKSSPLLADVGLLRPVRRPPKKSLKIESPKILPNISSKSVACEKSSHANPPPLPEKAPFRPSSPNRS